MADDEPLVYIDGKYYPKSEAKISVHDHGLLYGDGIFEGIRAYNGVVFKLREHVDRLFRSAKAMKLTIPMTKEGVERTVIDTFKENGMTEGYVRVLVTRGPGDLGVDPRTCTKPSVIMMAERIGATHGTQAKLKGISVIISSIRRDRVDATSHEIKSLNYLNSVLAKLEGIEAGANEAIMLDDQGFVSEGPTTNIFAVKDGEVITPPPTAGILRGVTRGRVIELARQQGYRVAERNITAFELVNADEAFLTGTHAEIVPIVKVKGIVIGEGKPGPVTISLIEAFEKIRADPREGTRIA